MSDKIVPNPYLKLPKRDITSNYGDNLTLLNPAYMTRLFHEFSAQYYGKRENHLTSLDPINPVNKAYEWEIEPLKSFEKGENEFFEIQTENNKKKFRYMAPIYVEKECLKCHGEGIYKIGNRVYKIGDLRGGISVSLDFEPFLADAKANHGFVGNIYILSGFLGLLGLFLFYKYFERSEINLINEKEKFRTIFEYSPVAMFFYDNFGNILEINHKLQEIAGGTEEKIKKINLFKLDNKEFQSNIEKSISEGEGYFEGWYTTMARNKKIYLEAIFKGFKNKHGIIDSGIGIFKDNTEIDQQTEQIKNMEMQVLQLQKLESIGRLAGGVAHDFNNILTVILSYAEIAYGEISESSAQKKYMKNIIEAVGKASKLTQQLLIFSRKKVLNPEVIDTNNLLKDFHKMLGRLVPENIEIVLNLRNGLKNVFIYTGQLEQAIMNIVVNAKDAMPNGGEIKIETENIYLDEFYANNHAGAKPGEYVMISISDTGVGMSKDIIEHIFEPFFTTKEIGKGTGMGLAVVYSIIKQSGGNIYIYSEPNIGTTFKLYLPVSGNVDAIPKSEKEELIVGNSNNNDFKILLVEDEVEIGNVFEDILHSKGFEVLYVDEPLKALEIVKNGEFIPDLLITDVIMPKLNGIALVEQLKRLIPDLKYFLMSGYPDDILKRQGYELSEKELLRKPVKISDFLNKVEVILKDHK